MVDRPPAQRYRIVEQGGRLQVIDLETGAPPLSAAERMAAHDAAHGHAALKFDKAEEKREQAVASAPASAAPSPTSSPTSGPAATNRPTDPIRARLEAKATPWQAKGEARPPKAKQTPAPSASNGGRPAPMARGGRGDKPIVTGKWWDNKGPRTITLGAAGRAKLTNGFLTVLVIGFVIALAMLIIQPALLLIAGFLLFRFGDQFFAPIGARLIDAAIQADGGSR